MEFYKRWWFFLLMILIIILFFPKTCGKINVTSDVNYLCYGKLSKFIGQNFNWCYGICIESDKTLEIKNNESSSNPNFFLKILGDNSKYITAGFIIFLIIICLTLLKPMFKKPNK